MMRNNLLFVVGARPNFIKMAPICRALRLHSDISYEIVHTGQHYDGKMSDIFFEELRIDPPAYNLGVGSASHGQQTGSIMIALEEICLNKDFSTIVVIGDVNSTIAGALVGAKLQIPVAHVESGLRSFNRKMPEEINRIATDHISDLLFAPTQLAMKNLKNEGLSERSIFSGDVMYDMILQGIEIAEDNSQILKELNLEKKEYFLSTLHRPYNVDDADQLREILKGLSSLSKPVVLAAHPRLKKMIREFEIEVSEKINILPPLGYLDFIWLEKNAEKIITDSGGVQKEAFFVKTPCVTLRPETEWVETLECNANTLVKDRNSQSIINAVNEVKDAQFQLQPYGDGSASKIIVENILENLSANN